MSGFPSLSRSIRLIVVLSRPFSLLLFSISHKNKNPDTYVFRATIVGVICSIVKAIIEFSVAYVMFTTLFNVYLHHKSVINLFLVLIYSMANLLAAIHEIHAALNQKQVVEVLNELQYVDDELMALQIFPKNHIVFPVAAAVALISTILWITVAAMHELIYADVVVLWVGFVVPYIIMYIGTFHFLGLILLIGQRFKLLNDNLRELLNYMNDLNTLRTSLSGSDVILGVRYRLKILQHLRGTLVILSAKVNSAYSVQLLMMFVTYFAVFVQKVHRVTVVKHDTPLNVANSAYVALCLANITLTFVAVCWACTACISHAKNTATIMLTSVPEVQDSQMKTFFEQFMLQLLLSDVNFTVCGLFSLDLSLLLGMTSTVAAYIGMCIQFAGDQQ